MAGRRKVVAVLSAVIALLLSGAVTGLARVPEATVNVSTGAAPPDAETETDFTVEVGGTEEVAPPSPVTAAPPTAVTSATTSAAPSSTTLPVRRSGTTVHRDQPRGPDEVGSAADLGPGEVVQTGPAPCTPSSQPTPPSAITVVEVRLGCVRPLVPAGEWAGPEVSWSPDGSWLLTTVGGRVVRLARDGSWRQDLGGGEQVEFAVLSPDGSRVAMFGHVPFGHLDQKPALIVASADGTGATIVEQVEHNVIEAPSWSPDSQMLAVVTSDGPSTPDVLTLVGVDGRVRASRTFPNRAFHGVNGGPLSPGPAPLGRPVFLPDGRLFLPAFVELPQRATGLWLNRALDEVGGREPPGDLMYRDGLSVRADGSALVYVGAYGPTLATPIRRLDLRTGQTVTLAANGAMPSAAHRTNAVAFVTRSVEGMPQGVTVVDAPGSARPLWRHTGTNCTCIRSGAAWTADDTALAIAT